MVFCIIRCLGNCGTCFYVSEWHAHTSSKCAAVTLRRQNTSHNFKRIFNNTIIVCFYPCQMLWFSILYVASEIVGRVFTSQNDMRTLHQSVRMSLWDVKTHPTISRGSCEATVLLTFSNPCYKIRCNCGTCFHVSELHHTIWTPSKLEVLSMFWHAISHILS